MDTNLLKEVARLWGLINSAFLSAKEVRSRYGWSESTFYRRQLLPGFPRPAKFPGRTWRLADLVAAELDGRLKCPTSGLI